MAAPVASLDLGTNSTRLLIAAPDEDGRLEQVERLMRITRLGQGVDRTGSLADEAIERTLDVLREYRAVLDRNDVAPERIRIAATSASRDASNRGAFFDAVAETIGVRPELLSGEEEASCAFAGATADLPAGEGPVLVFDLGGGSTEFILGTPGPDGGIDGAVSLDIGCVRLTERFVSSDPPAPEDLSAAISYVDTWLDDVVRLLPGWSAADRVIGLAGTVSTVAAVEIGLAEYDRNRIHGFELTREAAEDVFRTLATEPLEDRIHNPGLEEARAEVIIGGCCALVGIFRRLDLDRITVSEADILDGLALSAAR